MYLIAQHDSYIINIYIWQLKEEPFVFIEKNDNMMIEEENGSLYLTVCQKGALYYKFIN